MELSRYTQNSLTAAGFQQEDFEGMAEVFEMWRQRDRAEKAANEKKLEQFMRSLGFKHKKKTKAELAAEETKNKAFLEEIDRKVKLALERKCMPIEVYITDMASKNEIEQFRNLALAR